MTCYDRFTRLDYGLLAAVSGRYVGFYYDGLDAVGWYGDEARAVAELADYADLDVTWLAGLVAALSPVISVTGNAQRVCCVIALHSWGMAWEEAVMALPATPRSVKTHALTFLRTGRLGPKTGAFARNLAGDGSAITIDTWMAKAAGLPHSAVTGKDSGARLACEAAVAAIAEVTGDDPAAVQAAIWYGCRRAHNRQDTRDSLRPTFEAFMAE